ncbi:MAG: hypothetical protein FVQ83_09550 [Chloroflexi bacterium]|nr:hypothetical protein [Chloroflexota bacterium]
MSKIQKHLYYLSFVMLIFAAITLACGQSFRWDTILGLQLPAWSPDGDRIAFISCPGEDALRVPCSLYTILVDGSGLSSITDAPVVPMDNSPPKWMPDNHTIYFFTYDFSGYQDRPVYWLSVSDIDGSMFSRIDRIWDGSAISSDGSKFAWASGCGDCADYGLNIENSDGSGELLNFYVSSPSLPVWAPGDGCIAFRAWSYDSSDYGIYLLDIEEGDPFRLVDHQDETPAVWSPDGMQIAFASSRNGGWGIYLIDLSDVTLGTQAAQTWQLTSNAAGFDTSPAWSPDGQKIAFVSTQDGNPEIYLIDVDGSNLTRLTNSPQQERYPVWSPDGTQIAFISFRDSAAGEIYIINIDGTNLTRLTNFIGLESSP